MALLLESLCQLFLLPLGSPANSFAGVLLMPMIWLIEVFVLIEYHGDPGRVITIRVLQGGCSMQFPFGTLKQH